MIPNTEGNQTSIVPTELEALALKEIPLKQEIPGIGQTQDKGVIKEESKRIDMKVIQIEGPIIQNPGIQVTNFEKHSIKDIGKLTTVKINPISKYQFFIDNYHYICYEPHLKNIPSHWVILRIYDLNMYCIQSVYYFFLFSFFRCCPICCLCPRMIFDESSLVCIIFKLYLGMIFFALFIVIPGVNIAFVILNGLLTIYFLAFLILRYYPNKYKVDIFQKAILVSDKNPFVVGHKNRFLEITSQVIIKIHPIFMFC